MSRTGQNIYKRKDGRWEGRFLMSYTKDGKKKMGYVYSNSYSSVKGLLCAKAANGYIIDPKTKCTYTLEGLGGEWLDKVKTFCKLSTYNKYYNTFNKIIVPEIGRFPIDRVSGKLIDSFIAKMLTVGTHDKPYSHRTAAEICSIIKQIIKFGKEEYNIIPQFSDNRLKIRQSGTSAKVLDQHDAKKLTAFLTDQVTPLKLGVLISLYTGLRIGEVCALRWSDINFRESTMSISKTIQRVQLLNGTDKKTRVIETTPKSFSSYRTIPVPHFLIEILKDIEPYDDYYIVSASNILPEPRHMQNCFKTYLKKCGIEHVNFHTLRHTFASRCIELGFDAKTLSEILGHSSVNVTLNRYVHLTMKQKKTAMNLVRGV